MLTPGARIGHYEIVGVLGVGGMGEVYRSRDSQLKRDVAIKILPADIVADTDRLGRFQREAEILASLNHPNIAQVFGLADGDGMRGIVMEMAEGQTLAERVTAGPMPVGEVLGISRQIAEALEAAHDRDVVHRDLKPANIKVTSDGVVKVLDFGLAKALSQAEAQASALQTSPAMTRAGIILGTAAYMSPEQARGRVVDARTDIWAFGCVLFEMLTGRRPFDGETVTDILGAIVHKEPQWNLLPATLPDSLRRLLVRCLAKDQKQRLHNIADARLEIQDLIARAHLGGDARVETGFVQGPSRMTRREAIAWSLVAAAIVAAISATALLWMRPAPVERSALRLSMIHTEGGEVGLPAMSPDGRRVAYPARSVDGMPMVWVRDLGQSTPQPLAGTEGGNRLFWSPDSKRVGFIVGATIKHISADGGPVQEVARRAGGGASWSSENVIVYTDANGVIQKIPATGGQAVAVTTLQGRDWGHYWPSMLPGGRHFLFTAKHWAGLADSGAQGVYIGSVDNASDIHQLLPDLSSAVYAAPGFVVFARNNQLMAAPFDLGRRRIGGEPTPLGEAVAVDAMFYLAGVSADVNGALAIRPPPAPLATSASGPTAFDSELTFLKRDGTEAGRFGGVQTFSEDLALSPDGKTVIALVQDTRTSGNELWQFDVATGARTPLTSMRASGGYVGAPVWSADGTRVAYACQPPGILDDVCIRDLRTGAVTTPIQSKATWEHPVAWSPDGQHMLVTFDEYTESGQELRVWSARTSTLSPFAPRGFSAVFAPDGRFVAITSPESGRLDVYITTFPERRQTWTLTTEGGRALSWSADGKELLVATVTGHIVAYPVNTGGDSFSAGVPKILLRNVGFDALYAQATRDHSRILVRVPKDADRDRGEIRLLFGWANSLIEPASRE